MELKTKRVKLNKKPKISAKKLKVKKDNNNFYIKEYKQWFRID